MPIAALLVLAIFIASGDAAAQRTTSTAVIGAPSVSAARAKPTAEEKRCLASRRRVERQHEVIAQADERFAKEQKARETCKTKRVCENLDRALKASETRQQRHAKQLAQFQGEAEKACASMPDASKAQSYRSSTAVTSSAATTSTNSTK